MIRQGMTDADIAQALADLRAFQQRRAERRAARDERYAEQLAKHTVHPPGSAAHPGRLLRMDDEPRDYSPRSWEL